MSRLRFRPLDGESFSKLEMEFWWGQIHDLRFRALDGESFSKLHHDSNYREAHHSFRPLDGESFSKR